MAAIIERTSCHKSGESSVDDAEEVLWNDGVRLTMYKKSATLWTLGAQVVRGVLIRAVVKLVRNPMRRTHRPCRVVTFIGASIHTASASMPSMIVIVDVVVAASTVIVVKIVIAIVQR